MFEHSRPRSPSPADGNLCYTRNAIGRRQTPSRICEGMRDKRPVDELSIAELERILAIRKRALRQERLRRLEQQGRRVSAPVELSAGLSPEPSTLLQDAEPVAPPPPHAVDDVPRFEDESVTPPQTTAPPRAAGSHPARRRFFDRVLLAVEVIGVVGIVAILLLGSYLVMAENNRIEELAQKSADIQREANALRVTATPRPDLSIRLSDYVLPGGHYSPDTTGGEYAFNLDEVPESLRPVVLAQLTAPRAERATPQPSSPVRIVINTARVQVDASIYEGDDWEQLLKGVGHYTGSGNPGEPRNMVLVAHNDIYGEIFRDIQYLEPGDEIRIQANNNRWYSYVVYDKFVVEPSDVWVLAPGNEPIVTLITCHPYRVDTQRMIVVGRLQAEGVSS